MRIGKDKASAALAGFDDQALKPIWEQARGAQLARRKTFVARLPLPDGAESGDVPFWAAAIQQIESLGFRLEHWSVCPEVGGPVGYAVFRSA
jgi:hypothetical protein